MQEGEVRVYLNKERSGATIMRNGSVEIITVEEALDIIRKHNASATADSAQRVTPKSSDTPEDTKR